MASAEHEHAEKLSVQAAAAARAHDADRARRLYFEAALSERKALDGITERSSRTWGILAKSTAYLYYKSRDLAEAQEFASTVLENAEISASIRDELRQLLNDIRQEILIDASDTDASFDGRQPGATVGRYLMLERVGVGAMGDVYAAYDPEFERKVAIKFLRAPKGRRDADRLQERLFREAKELMRLSHPNIVGVYDVGMHEGGVFVVMEYLSGGTLRHWLNGRKRPWRDIVKMFIEVGKGLAVAHAQGILHRDFKPDNVLLDLSGRPKVVDFDLVRLTSGGPDFPLGEVEGTTAPVSSAEVAALTRTGALTGTPAYMAGEQFLGKPIDARTDQFSFFVSLFEALYGERPFSGDSVIGLADSVTEGRVREPTRFGDVPRPVYRILRKGLAKSAADRFPDMPYVVHALERQGNATIRARRVAATALAAAAVALLVARAHLPRQAAIISNDEPETSSATAAAAAPYIRLQGFADGERHDSVCGIAESDSAVRLLVKATRSSRATCCLHFSKPLRVHGGSSIQLAVTPASSAPEIVMSARSDNEEASSASLLLHRLRTSAHATTRSDATVVRDSVTSQLCFDVLGQVPETIIVDITKDGLRSAW